MNFAAALHAIADALRREGIDFALIGGFALAALGVARATGDLDFLVDGDRADDLDRIVQTLGYRCLHRSADAANYASDEVRLGSVDFLFARRDYSRGMLSRARGRVLAGLDELKVVEAEDLIGLKVQALANNPARRRLDLGDIERLLGLHPDLDLVRVREYFRLFEMEAELDAIIDRLSAS